MGMDYKSAGVDVDAGYQSVELIRKCVQQTYRKEVLSDLGGFGGLFSIAKAKDMADPVLVSGTDGVGTKLKLAFLMDQHNTIGVDCVAMCVNDIVVSGAEPLFFLDYIACGKNVPVKIASIVEGIAAGCKLANVSLIGGETAEMPGFYQEDEYDLAGFSVGIVDRQQMIDGSKIKKGDILIGLESNGLHSNGFSLVRKIFRPTREKLQEQIQFLNSDLGTELLKPTRIYVPYIMQLKNELPLKGIAHITGGGFYENIPRVLPKGMGAAIQECNWDKPPIFEYLQKGGQIDKADMFHTFNMGIGMMIVVAPEHADGALRSLAKMKIKAFAVGEVLAEEGIQIC